MMTPEERAKRMMARVHHPISMDDMSLLGFMISQIYEAEQVATERAAVTVENSHLDESLNEIAQKIREDA